MNLLSTLSFTSILGYLPWATAILRVNPFAGCFVRLSFARQFDRVSSGSRFQADADQRKLFLVLASKLKETSCPRFRLGIPAAPEV